MLYCVDFPQMGFLSELTLPEALESARTGRAPRGRADWFDCSQSPTAIIHRSDEREIIPNPNAGEFPGDEFLSIRPDGVGRVFQRCL